MLYIRYIRKALEQLLEDREDYLLAVARSEENNPRIPYEKIRKELLEVNNLTSCLR